MGPDRLAHAHRANDAVRSSIRRQKASPLDLVAETGEFWFGHSISVREYTQMVPLRQRTGVMRKPLDDATPVT